MLLYGYVLPPLLHSFPTRRSSDLPTAPKRVLGPAGTSAEATDLVPRSEEHTSELQSQSNLVCRLLLEKKKKRDIPHLLGVHRADAFEALAGEAFATDIEHDPSKLA